MPQLKVVHGSIWHRNGLYADLTQLPEAKRERAYAGDTLDFNEADEDDMVTYRELQRMGVAKRPEDLLTPEQALDLTSENQALKDRQAALEQQLAEALAAIEASKSIQ